MSTCDVGRDLLSVQILLGLDAVIIRTGHDLPGFKIIGIGEIIFLLSFLCDAHAVDDCVKSSRIYAYEKRIPCSVNKLNLNAEFFGYLLCQLYVNSCGCSVILVIGEGRIGSLDTDYDLSGGLDLFELVTASRTRVCG